MAKLFSLENYLDPVCIDYETNPIEQRPVYPPEPVGVSIQYPGEQPFYMSWGHPTKNNCTKAEAKKELKRIYAEYPILMHNAKFDLDVGNVHMGLPLIPKHGYHDTQFLAFLLDPHAETLKLKDMADKHLDLPPDEQTDLNDWLCENQATYAHKYEGKTYFAAGKEVPYFAKLASGKFRRRPRSWAKWGAVICEAPGDVCGNYANGDTLRTSMLFDKFIDQCENMGMLDAYRRELELMPILLENERLGVRVDLDRLRKDLDEGERSMEIVDNWLARKLKTPKLNVDSGEELADALEFSGYVKRHEWKRTPKGARSTSKDNIAECISDKDIIAVLNYRSLLGTSLKLFIRKWVELAEANEGFIFTNWNQTKNMSQEGKGKGARTGRASSNPNFQNMTKYPMPIFFSSKSVKDKIKEYAKERYDEIVGSGGETTMKACIENVESEFKYLLLPKSLEDKIIKIPKIRNYIIPDSKDDVIIRRDYSQQELRILAHFAGGEILEAYIENPNLDIHDYVLKLVNQMTNGGYSRKQIKTVNFGLIYGMGIGLLADRMGSDKDTAKKVKKAVLQALPGLKRLDSWAKRQGKQGQPITTWGGRVYYVEPPKWVKKKDWETGKIALDKNGNQIEELRTFEYKLLNILIQGSAADCTKEGIINYGYSKKDTGRFLLQVHDEIVCSVPKSNMRNSMRRLEKAMENVNFDIPMLSDGDWSDKSYGELKEYIN